ncbi:MAG: glycosyltransferase family 39 protein, partial [Puniceicoccaceae bacterium]
MIDTSRMYHRLTAVVILLFLVTGLLGVKDYGMGWDEVTRWDSGDLKFLYYEKLLAGEAAELEQRMAGDRYPGLFDLPLAAFNAAFGGNRMLQGHLLSLAFGVLGLVATAWMAFLVFNPRVAFFSTLFLAILPHFYGHAMINPKDIPFMATYTLGLATVLRVSQRLVLHENIRWYRFVLCGLAIGMAGAARVPGLVLLAIAGASWLAASLYG